MSDLLPDNPPTPENGYTVDSTMEITAELFNHVFGSIHARLVAREDLEATFEGMVQAGTSAGLTMIQENIAPQILGLQQAVEGAQDVVADLLVTGTAPNAAKLGNQMPGYYLARANHTGTQAISTVDGLQDELAGKLPRDGSAVMSGDLILRPASVYPTVTVEKADPVGYPLNRLYRARGAPGALAAIKANDVLGTYSWYGHDGSAYVPAARIWAQATTDFDANINTRLDFFVRNNGVETMALRLWREGRATLGAGPVNSMDAATKQYVDGSAVSMNGGVLVAGYTATSDDEGTKSSGTYTPVPAEGNFKHIVNGGAFTLAAPAGVHSMVIQIDNNASAGAITMSGFTKVGGSSFTTTYGHKFLVYITRTNSYSHANVVALQ